MSTRRRESLLAMWPLVLAAAPKCPACLPVYGWLVGATSLATAAYLSGLAALAVILALVSVRLAWRAGARPGAIVLALAALAAIFAGRFLLAHAPTLYFGLAALVAAAVWNAAPRSVPPAPTCQPTTR